MQIEQPLEIVPKQSPRLYEFYGGVSEKICRKWAKHLLKAREHTSLEPCQTPILEVFRLHAAKMAQK